MKSRPIGATGIGRQGAKYRVRSNGQSSAAPRPPSVIVSSSPWLASTTVATSTVRTTGRVNRRAANPTASPRTIAVVRDGSPAMTPRVAVLDAQREPDDVGVGQQESADHDAIEDHGGVRPSRYTRAAAMPTAMCPMLAISQNSDPTPNST